jgi:CheY-like chemotaxis protein
MSPAEDPMQSPEAGKATTVLVVEDEIMVRLGLAAHLRAGLKPDLVFSDINMPGTDGVGLSRWLAGNSDARVVLTSGSPAALDEARAACPNVSAFLPKPYDEDRLVTQLRAVLKA